MIIIVPIITYMKVKTEREEIESLFIISPQSRDGDQKDVYMF